MEILFGVNFKTQSCPLVWREVELRLSHEQHWAAHDVPVLTVSRRRGRFGFGFGGFDRVLLDQIVLDPTLRTVRLLPQSDRDRRRLRFALQHGNKRSRFQAPDQFTLVAWTVAIASAIEKAVLKATTRLISSLATGQSDREHVDVYTRDSSNARLVRLIRRAARGVVAATAVENSVNTTQQIEPTDEAAAADVANSRDESAETCADPALGHLFDAVQHDCGLTWRTTASGEEAVLTSLDDEGVSFNHLFDAMQHLAGVNTKIIISHHAGSSMYETVAGDKLVLGHLFDDVESDTSSNGDTSEPTGEIVLGHLADAIQHESSVTLRVAILETENTTSLETLANEAAALGCLFDAVHHRSYVFARTMLRFSKPATIWHHHVVFAHLFDAVQHDCGVRACASTSQVDSNDESIHAAERHSDSSLTVATSSEEDTLDSRNDECFGRNEVDRRDTPVDEAAIAPFQRKSITVNLPEPTLLNPTKVQFTYAERGVASRRRMVPETLTPEPVMSTVISPNTSSNAIPERLVGKSSSIVHSSIDRSPTRVRRHASQYAEQNTRPAKSSKVAPMLAPYSKAPQKTPRAHLTSSEMIKNRARLPGPPAQQWRQVARDNLRRRLMGTNYRVHGMMDLRPAQPSKSHSNVAKKYVCVELTKPTTKTSMGNTAEDSQRYNAKKNATTCSGACELQSTIPAADEPNHPRGRAIVNKLATGVIQPSVFYYDHGLCEHRTTEQCKTNASGVSTSTAAYAKMN